MQAKIDFDESIKEVTYLNTVSYEVGADDKVYHKVIVLLLCAKLEKYVKDSTKEYIDTLIDMHLTKKRLPPKFIKEIINNEIKKIEEVTIDKYLSEDKYKSRAQVLSLIWDNDYVIENLNKDEFSISIANNGTTAFNDIYKKIGFPDIIKNLSDYIQETNINGVVTATSYSISENINKVICIRHNVIHDDVTPQITKSDVSLYVEIFIDFVKQVDAILSSSIKTLRQA